MYLTDEGLKQIEHCANKKHDASTMLLVQVLQELRELKKLLNKPQNSSDSSNENMTEIEKGESNRK